MSNLKVHKAYGVEGLTKAESLVARFWDGDVESTAKLADLTPSLVKRAMDNPSVLEAVQAREMFEDRSGSPIATRKRRQQFWTEIMFDEDQPMQQRLKASELLGKSEADFTDKIEHEGKITLAQMLEGFDDVRRKKDYVNDEMFN